MILCSERFFGEPTIGYSVCFLDLSILAISGVWILFLSASMFNKPVLRFRLGNVGSFS